MIIDTNIVKLTKEQLRLLNSGGAVVFMPNEVLITSKDNATVVYVEVV